ncbi:TPA: hypothetical protein ACJ5UW_000860 [Streptococcus agalactiae]|jgi:hypothetical protein|uniref:hypothetical protein n=1 Tax=Streptococcus TaxID=1301 RepID=UPI0003907E66|nr:MULTISPECIES: hypothetical protein [Streptococcus]AGU79760.1 hypothetical protein SCI_0812 [Streptococcus constellatus subsp. pharyngis C1050]EUC75488.1 hypothetical protein HMPREF1511_1153 [Streptococcus sp. CM7]MCW1080528.1 hypothetical protein [Streptococcus anginosus]MCW1088574.1 hypothetical protein [Streptococcus anginosus]MDX5092788.1 hypothetical protein [Streptococcus anginosus]
MTKAFDEATYRQDFEAINGRQPSEEGLEQAKDLVERYIVGKDDDSGVVTYYPSKRSRFKALMGSTFGWIKRGGVFLVMTPVFLTLLFFNLIKSTIGVFVIWFISKVMLGFIFMGIVFLCDQAAFNEPEKTSGLLRDVGTFLFGERFFTYAVPNFFPHPTVDAWIIGIAIVVCAFGMTFSRYEA